MHPSLFIEIVRSLGQSLGRVGIEGQIVEHSFPLTIWYRHGKYHVRNLYHETEDSSLPEIHRVANVDDVLDLLNVMGSDLNSISDVRLFDLSDEPFDSDQDSDNE